MKRLTLIIIFISILLHLSFLLSLKTGFWNPCFNDTAPYTKGPGGDFFVFYSAAKNILEGKSIYSYPGHPSVPYSHGPYIYLPHLLLLILPFTLFSPWTAYVLWVIFSEGLLWWCAYLTYRMAQKLQYPYPWMGAAIWLVFTPIYPNFYLGQAELLLAFFFMLALWGEIQRKSFLSYLGWTLGTFVKIIPLPFALAFLRQRKARWVFLTLGLTLGPLLIYLAFYHPGHLIKQHLIRIQSLAWAYAGAPNFMVLLDLWGLPAAGLLLIQLLLVILALILSLAKEAETLDNWSLWIATFLLVHGFTWEHHYVLLLPFLAFYLLQPKNSWMWAVYLLLALPTPFVFYQKAKIYDPLYYLSKVIPLLTFHLYLVGRHLRAPTRWLYFDQGLKNMCAKIKN